MHAPTSVLLSSMSHSLSPERSPRADLGPARLNVRAPTTKLPRGSYLSILRARTFRKRVPAAYQHLQLPASLEACLKTSTLGFD